MPEKHSSTGTTFYSGNVVFDAVVTLLANGRGNGIDDKTLMQLQKNLAAVLAAEPKPASNDGT